MASYTLEATSAWAVASSAAASITLPVRTAGNLLLVYAGNRNTAGGPSDPSGWTRLAEGSNDKIRLYGRIATNDGSDAFSISWGGSAGRTAAQMTVWSGDVYTDLNTIVAHSAIRTTASASDLPYEGLTISTDDCLVLIAASKEKTATSDGATINDEAGFTELGEDTSAGNSLQIVWNYVQQTTAANITAGTYDFTGTTESRPISGFTIALNSADPTVNFVGTADVTPTTDGFLVEFETSGATTVYLLALPVDTATPANLAAAQALAIEEVSGAANGVDDLTLTGILVPEVDLYLYTASGDSEILVDERRLPITGYTISVADGNIGTDSIYDGASPAVAAGDITEHKSTTVEGDYAATLEADGDFIVLTLGDTSRQTIPFYFWDRSTNTRTDYTALTDRFVLNNTAPRIDPDVITDDDGFAAVLNLAKDEDAGTVDISSFFLPGSDAEPTYSVAGDSPDALPTGITLNPNGTLTLLPTAYAWGLDVRFVAIDDVGAVSEPLAVGVNVGERVPDVLGDTQAAGTAELEADSFVVSVGAATRSSAYPTVGDIARTSPVAGGIIEDGSTVTIHLSLGPGKGVGRPFCFSWWES